MARGYSDPRPDVRGGPRFARQYGVGSQQEPSPPVEDPAPPPHVVQQFHTHADTDARKESIHHTLGAGPAQAAAGDHNHDGSNSRLLLEGHTIVGSKNNPQQVLPSIIECLVRLGATDSTT